MTATQLPETEPLVSVLIPSYNHEKYVIECLDSISSLDYRNLELIVSDDASPDSTFDLAQRWIEENSERFVRAIVVRQTVNLGIVRNLQYLFDQAQGEFIAYLASDDRLLPASIRSRLQVFQKDASVDAVFGNARQVLTDGSVLKPKFIPSHIAAQLCDKRLMLSSLILNWRVPGPVTMLRRKAVATDGSLGRLPVDLEGEDGYIYIRLAAQGKLAFTDEVVAEWRIVPGSLSNATRRDNFTRRYTVESDRKNLSLVHGLDRLAIALRIADSEVVLNSRSRLKYLCMRVFLRVVVIQLRFLLRLRAFATGKL